MPESPASDYYVVIHVWTTCDEHGVCVSKDSAEVIEIAWILINSKTLEEVSSPPPPKSLTATTKSIYRLPLARVVFMLTPMETGPARRSPDQAGQHSDYLPLQYLIHQKLSYRAI